MKLALWQGTSPASDLASGLTQVETAVAAAAAMGAAALVLPEVWLPGYNQNDIAARAMPVDSPPLQRLANAAKTS
jgi:5-aminopentanamidase